MRAVTYDPAGNAADMGVESVPCPVPQAGEVLIKVHAAGLNRPDILQRKGKYPPPPGASPILGLEVAGEIVAGDLTHCPFHLGQAVCALVAGGGYAEYCVAPLACCLPLPAGLSWVQGAALPEVFFTVWSNVWLRAALQPQELLLVHGGGSGIGVAAIQLARLFGHSVYCTVGSAEKKARCEALGAVAVNYREQDFVEFVLKQTQGRGVNVILDMVAGSYVTRNLACLAEEGRLAIIALQGGKQAEVDMAPVLLRRLSITGSTLRSRPVSYKAQIAQALLEKVWPYFGSGQLTPIIDTVAPLEGVGQMHQRMESNQHFGKLVLQVT
ncbi:NAD(P)H-quinone oxidoreductase [Parvibium lacunae]|uniref:NAD(P)H-quinone oxidoreductase n=1 Tax=Parvibium lacunae TaxID=1888893 RepID=A0A368L8K6_9BURK|nr:NAD(P)H-quinone oxidoreductase [Parvibium lacunae]RCS59892.1 NAD(P)H-quinone oxidoreductase [Parvibium lacunae]